MVFCLTSEAARERAAACASKAEECFDDDARILFERLRDRWIALAQKFELEEAQSVS
jgi:hypothetical protein